MLGLDKFNKLLSVIIKDELMLNEQLCTRSINSKNDCSLCEKICPEKIISLENSGLSVDLLNCNECGLCVSVCPNGVFELQKPTDIDIYKQIKLAAKTEKTVSFKCSLSPERTFQSSGQITVKCLGRLHEGLIFGALYYADKNNVKTISLDISECGNCEIGAKEQMLSTIKKAKSLAEALQLGTRIETGIHAQASTPSLRGALATKQSQDTSFSFSRRDFLNHLREKSYEKSAEVVASSIPLKDDEEKNESSIPQSLPVKRHHLLQLINMASKATGKAGSDPWQGQTLGRVRPLIFGQVRITDNCGICDFCSKLCPTGAIKKIDENDKIEIKFNSSYCTGCGVCKDICPDNAIQVATGDSLQENFDDIFQFATIHTANIKNCDKCGLSFSSKDKNEKLCRFCKKKEMFFGSA